MADDLRDALHGLYATHESTAAATPAGPALALATVSRKARRRRAARTAGTGAVVVALVGVVTVGAAAARTTWWSPQPAATSPVTATPSPTPSPSGTAADVTATVTSSPFLPAAQPLPAGFLEQTDATWNLVAYDSRDGSHPAVLYLVGPEGQLVEVPSPLAGALRSGDEAGPRVIGWLPGTTRVLVPTASGTGDTAAAQVVDLLSGEPSATFEGSGAVYPSVGFLGDGTTDVLVEAWSQEDNAIARLYRATAEGRCLPRWPTCPARRAVRRTSPSTRHGSASRCSDQPVSGCLTPPRWRWCGPWPPTAAWVRAPRVRGTPTVA
ncbi:hypothetical protein [Cellulomonas soli]